MSVRRAADSKRSPKASSDAAERDFVQLQRQQRTHANTHQVWGGRRGQRARANDQANRPTRERSHDATAGDIHRPSHKHTEKNMEKMNIRR